MQIACLCLDGAGAFPNLSTWKETALGFHFSRDGSWQLSGASGKFSPSWWGDLVHKSVGTSGQDYSLAWNFLQEHTKTSKDQWLQWSKPARQYQCTFYFNSFWPESVHSSYISCTPRRDTRSFFSCPPPAPRLHSELGVSGSPVTPFTHVPPCPTIPSLSDNESHSSLQGIREVRRQWTWTTPSPPWNVLLLLLSARKTLPPGILLCPGPSLAGLKVMVSSCLCCDLSRGNLDVWQTAFQDTQCLHYPQTLVWSQVFTRQPLLIAVGAWVQCKFGMPPAHLAARRC